MAAGEMQRRTTGTKFVPAIAAAAALAVAGMPAYADTIVKDNNANVLSDPNSWVGLIAPDGDDIALWNATAGTNTNVALGADVAWGQIRLEVPGANLTIPAGNTLTLNGLAGVGIDLSTVSPRTLTLAAPVVLGASQSWLVNSGRSIFVNGGVAGGSNGLTVQGLGLLQFGGAVASTYTGTTTINGAQFKLNFTNLPSPNSLMSPSSGLSLSSGFFLVQSNSGAGSPAVQQSVNGVSINQGASIIQAARGISAGLSVGTLSRGAVGGTVLLNATNGSTNGSTSNFIRTANGANTFIGGWAVFNINGNNQGPTDFAFQNTLNLTAPTYTNDVWAPGNNTNVTIDSTIAGGTNTQSLRFNAASARTITLGGTSQITSGGILLTPTVAANNQLITGGILKGSDNGDLIVHQSTGVLANGLGLLTINSEIANAVGPTALTKTGTGALVLGGNNTFTGGVFLNAGEIRLTNAGALNSATPNSVTFSNGNATSVLTQLLSVNGNSVSLAGLNTSAVVGTGAATPTVQNNNGSTAAVLTVNNATANTFGGTIQNGTGSAALGLIKDGAGALSLTGSLTYTGVTTVSNGTLSLGSTNNLNSSSAINVAGAATLSLGAAQSIGSGKTLSGSGAIRGAVTLASNSTTTPGGVSNVGTLSIDTLTLNSGSTTNFEFGVGNDAFDISTALTIGTFSTGGFNLLNTGGGQLTTTGTAFTLFDYTGATLAGFGNLNSSLILNPVGGLSYSFLDTGSAITLTLSGTASNNANWIENTGTGSWGTAGNWSTGIVPTNPVDTANFVSTTPNPAHTVDLDTNRTVGGVTFNSPTAYSIISGNGSVLSLDNGAASASVSNLGGTHSMSTALQLVSANTNFNVSNAGDTLSISGAISNTTGTSMTKIGNGELVLSGTNTFTGITSINVGTLRFANLVSLYNNNLLLRTDTNIVVNSGATAGFNVGGAGEFTAADIQALSALGTPTGGFTSGAILGLDTTNAGTFTYSNVIANPNGGANALAVSKLGTGALVLDQANTHTGGTILNAGTLFVNNAGALGTGPFVINGGTIDNSSGAAITVAPNVTQNWNGDFAFGGTNDLNLGIGAVTLGSGRTVTVNGGTLTVGGVIGGAAALTKAGAGTLLLTGANTYAGSTTISAGTLQVGNGAASGGLPGTQINNNAALAYNTTTTLNVSSLITGSGSITVATSAGNQINFTNSANSFTGGVFVTAGARVAPGTTGDGSYFGAGTLTLAGGTLFGSPGGSSNKVLSGNIHLAATTSNNFDPVGSTILGLSGNLSGSGTLTRTGGTGVVTLSGADNSNFSGTFALGSGVTAGLTFATPGSGSANAIWDFSNSSTTAGRGVNLANINGTISFGSLNAAIPDATFNNTIANTTSAATISVGGTNLDSNYGGRIAGLGGANAISLVKTGTAKLTLTGSNTYAGTTQINAGTLALGAGGSITSPTIGVAATAALDVTGIGGMTFTNQRLRGSGTVYGDTTFSSTGVVSVGGSAAAAAIGTLVAEGNFTLNTGATFIEQIDFGGNLAAPAVASDLLRVTVTGGEKTVTIGDGVIFDFQAFNADGGGDVSPDQTIVLIKNDGANAVVGTAANAIVTATPGFMATLVYNYNAEVGGVYTVGVNDNGNDVAAVISEVPEPTSLGLIGLGAAGLLGRRRRRMASVA